MNFPSGIRKAFGPSVRNHNGGAPGTVVIDSVSKRFQKRRIVKNSYSTLKSSFLKKNTKGDSLRSGYVTALDNVSVLVEPGKSLGVIGRNGSGKSTMLKLIAGIYQPDSGEVRVTGRISALIELGAGFHPDFTGRENIGLGGVMYGLTQKEIQSCFDDIVRYAELEDFIDQPVRTYSSGMYMRLGFSLAIHTDPDILLVDEVLAVGDAAFIHRCKDTISEFKRRGKTLIFVTHDLNSVSRWCDEAIWLDKGGVAKRGEPRWVIDSYLQAVEEKEQQQLASSNVTRSGQAGKGDACSREVQVGDAQSEDPSRWGNRDVEITSVEMKGEDGAKWLFHGDESAVIEVEFEIRRKVEDLAFGIGIIRADGLNVHGTNTDIEDIEIPFPSVNGDRELPVKGVYRFIMPRLGLVEDTYYLDVAAHNSEGLAFDYHHRLYKFSVRSSVRQRGVVNPEHRWEFEF